MADESQRTIHEGDEDVSPGAGGASRLPILVWAATSAVVLIYLAFGSVETRIWRLGRLTFQDRRIVHVWRYFGDRLPDMPGGPLFPTLYYLSLAVLVLGTILGVGMFLLTGDEDSRSTPDEAGRSLSPHE